MICPNCQAENRQGARFCDNCGSKLDITCPNCGTVNRPGAKFCDSCGHGLALDAGPTASSEESSDILPASRDNDLAPPIATGATHQPAIEKFMPRELAAKLQSAQTSQGVEGERRVVTALFCDVKGSTAGPCCATIAAAAATMPTSAASGRRWPFSTKFSYWIRRPMGTKYSTSSPARSASMPWDNSLSGV